MPEDIKIKHNLDKIVKNDDWVYVKIQKGMPSLKQSAILKREHLKSLEPYG